MSLVTVCVSVARRFYFLTASTYQYLFEVRHSQATSPLTLVYKYDPTGIDAFLSHFHWSASWLRPNAIALVSDRFGKEDGGEQKKGGKSKGKRRKKSDLSREYCLSVRDLNRLRGRDRARNLDLWVRPNFFFKFNRSPTYSAIGRKVYHSTEYREFKDFETLPKKRSVVNAFPDEFVVVKRNDLYRIFMRYYYFTLDIDFVKGGTSPYYGYDDLLGMAKRLGAVALVETSYGCYHVLFKSDAASSYCFRSLSARLLMAFKLIGLSPLEKFPLINLLDSKLTLKDLKPMVTYLGKLGFDRSYLKENCLTDVFRVGGSGNFNKLFCHACEGKGLVVRGKEKEKEQLECGECDGRGLIPSYSRICVGCGKTQFDDGDGECWHCGGSEFGRGGLGSRVSRCSSCGDGGEEVWEICPECSGDGGKGGLVRGGMLGGEVRVWDFKSLSRLYVDGDIENISDGEMGVGIEKEESEPVLVVDLPETYPEVERIREALSPLFRDRGICDRLVEYIHENLTYLATGEPRHGISQLLLAKKLGIDQPYASRILRKLVDRGYLLCDENYVFAGKGGRKAKSYCFGEKLSGFRGKETESEYQVHGSLLPTLKDVRLQWKLGRSEVEIFDYIRKKSDAYSARSGRPARTDAQIMSMILGWVKKRTIQKG